MTHSEILKKVEWKDLKNLSVKEMLIENNLTIPWLIISLTLAYYEHYIFALPFSCAAYFTAYVAHLLIEGHLKPLPLCQRFMLISHVKK